MSKPSIEQLLNETDRVIFDRYGDHMKYDMAWIKLQILQDHEDDMEEFFDKVIKQLDDIRTATTVYVKCMSIAITKIGRMK